MKLFGYLLSAYILLLSCVPCADRNEDCLNSNITKREHRQANKEQAEHEETCSPFCICSCCGQQVEFPVFTMTIKDIKTPDTKNKIPINSQHFVSAYVGNIWLPPKLS